MFKKTRLIVIQVKFLLWLPNYNICMVSNYSNPLKNGNLVRFERTLCCKKHIRSL